MQLRFVGFAAVLLVITGTAVAAEWAELWDCEAGWSSETGRYEAPRTHPRDLGFDSGPAINFSVHGDESFLAALNATQTEVDSQPASEDKECCRPTWECYDFWRNESKYKDNINWDDELPRKKAYCCIGQYMLTCSKPQLGQNLTWFEPPACSNRDVQAYPPPGGYPSG